ncbi:MAG: SDR family oxidoreductase [Bdellovibrionales bacterium]|nr:SDR family oxidoreductase [Bdellovibrionales bacterium]
MDWKSEVALITGASHGLGRALARELARRGARVVLTARTRAPLDAVVEEIRVEGGWATAIAGDAADIRSVHPTLGQAAALAGPVTLLVNNASTLGAVPLRPLLETECEDLGAVLETNLVGPFRFAKAVLGSMLVHGRGTIVNVSSDAATEAYPNWGAYSVSKAGLVHLTRIWAAELADSPVRFVSFDPGEMDTRMHADAIPDADRAALAKPEDVALRLVALLERKESADA